MEKALQKLQEKLDNYLCEILEDEYAEQKGKADTIKVSATAFLSFLRYNLLVSKASEEEKKNKWETLTSAIKNNKGEIPLVVMYDGIVIYTDTITTVRDKGDKKMNYYKKSRIATVTV